jgi:hypothetical protein
VLAIAWLVVVAAAESDAGVPFSRWVVLAGITMLGGGCCVRGGGW